MNNNNEVEKTPVEKCFEHLENILESLKNAGFVSGYNTLAKVLEDGKKEYYYIKAVAENAVGLR